MGADKVAVAGQDDDYASVEVYVEGADKALEWQDADGNPVTLYDSETGAFMPGTYTAKNGDSTVKVEVGADGTLKFSLISNTGEKQEANLTVKAIDADGDPASADVKLSTPEVTTPPSKPNGGESDVDAQGSTITVDEGALEDGSGQNAPHGTSGTGSVELEVNGEGNGKATATLSTIDADGNPKEIEFKLPDTVAVGKTHIDFPEGSTFVINGVEVTFTGADYDGSKWTLSYTYELTGDQNHDKEKGDDEVLGGDITVKVTDASGDEAIGKVTVEVHDDTPIWAPGSDSVTSQETLTSLNGTYHTSITFHGNGASQSDFEGCGLTQTWTASTPIKPADWDGGKKDFWFAGADHDSSHQTYIATTENGDIEIIPTFVHYKYVVGPDGQVQVDHVVDITNSIPRSAKALYLTEDGLTVGAYQNGAYNGKTGAWNGTTPDEISVGSGKNTNGVDGILNMPSGSGSTGVDNFESAYGDGHYLDKNGGIDADNVSEAIVFDSHNGLISYGFDIGLGLGDGDRVLLTFLMTPAHSSDDSIVKMVVISEGMDLGAFHGAVTYDEVTGTYRVSVPDGFTKVMVSALPSQDYHVDDDGFSATKTSKGEENSGFTIKNVDFLAATYTSAGQVAATSADGVSYDWNFENLKTDGSEVVFVKGVGGGKYAVTMDNPPKVEDDEITYTFRLSGGDLNGQTLFTATINTKTGEWSVTHFREFDMLNGKTAFQINGIDGDGDTATLELTITPEFMRFTDVMDGHYDKSWDSANVLNKDYADDILVGTDNNTLMYGKGGDDLLIGDTYTGGEADSGNETVDGYVNTILDATTKYNLNEVTSTGGETGKTSSVDTLYAGIKELSDEQKVLLGEELEKHEQQTHGRDALYGGRGDDLLFGAGGDDFLSGDLGKDIIYGGGGNDIILYDKEDLYIDGGSGNDIIVGGSETPSLAELRATEKGAQDGPVVRNVEMLLRSDSEFTSSLEISSHKSLAENYGITIDDNGVTLSAAWVLNEEKSTDDIKVYENANNGNKLTLEVYKNTTVYQPSASDPSMARAAGIAGEVGLLTALAAAEGVEAAQAPQDNGAAGQEGQAADSGLDAAAVSHAVAEADAPADTEAAAAQQDAFESLLADLGEVTPATLDSMAEARDNRYTAPAEESEAQSADSTAASEAAAHRAGAESSTADTGAHGSDLPEGVEIFRASDGDDFIDAGAGSHAIYAGAGDDLIVYDATDYLIDGGDGIDFLLSGSVDPAHSLADMLGNWEHNGADADMPMVHDVEVMLKGVDTSLQNMDSLAAKYGFSMGKDANGRDILMLDKGKWELDESQSGNGTNTYVNAESGITLETTLAEVGNTGTDAGEQAAQTIVLASNG